MSEQDRFFYIPPGAAERAAKAIDDAWRAAEQELYGAVDDPIAALQAAGDFAADLAHAAWNTLRGVAPAARMAWQTGRRVLDTPCNDPYTFLFETALPAWGDALYVLIVPSPKQILQNYLRPKGILGAARRGALARAVRRTTGRNGKRRRRWPSVPDVDEMIAAAIPARAALAGRNVGTGQRWLWTGIALADAIGLTLLLADISKNAFYGWAANMAASPFCSRTFQLLYVGELDRIEGAVGAHEAAVGHVPPWKTLHHVGAHVGPHLNFAFAADGTVEYTAHLEYDPDAAGGETLLSAVVEHSDGSETVLDERIIKIAGDPPSFDWHFSGAFTDGIRIITRGSDARLTAYGPGIALAHGQAHTPT